MSRASEDEDAFEFQAAMELRCVLRASLEERDAFKAERDALAARVRELEEALREKPAVSSEALDFAEMTLDGTLPYEETWRTNAEAVVALAARVRELEGALREISRQQPRTVDTMRRNHVVFDGPLGNDPRNWQHVAFSIYNDLVQVDGIARAALTPEEPT